MSKNISVFGIYPTRDAVTHAVDTLQAAGFRNTDISALFPDNQGNKDFAHEKSTKAPEGATTGVASGSVSMCGSIHARQRSSIGSAARLIAGASPSRS